MTGLQWDHKAALQWSVESGILTLAEALTESKMGSLPTPYEFGRTMVERRGWTKKDLELFLRHWEQASIPKRTSTTPSGGRKTVVGKPRSESPERKPSVAEKKRTTQKMKKWLAVTKVIEPDRTAKAYEELRESGALRSGGTTRPAPKWVDLAEGKSEDDGSSFGEKYLAGDELGRGGMGFVRVAKDQDLGRQVALKCLHSEYRNSEAMVRGLISEARLTGQLEHPNIIPVYELGMLPDGEAYYSMKLIEGRHFFNILNEDGGKGGEDEFGILRLLNVFQSLCMALSFAHSKGVVHRDVKPENVLVGEHGEVYLTDWGIAKLMSGDNESMFSGEGVVAGTAEYMSPEQAAGDGEEVNHRSDIYGLGVMLYEILTGELPLVFGPDYEEVTEGKMRPFLPPHERAPEQPLAHTLSTICMRALAWDPSDRYQDAKQLWRDIESEMEGSKERERARELAARAQKIGDGWREDFENVLQTRRELVAKVKEAERLLSPWEPESERARLWEWKNRLTSLEVLQGRCYTEAYKYYQQALGYDSTTEGAVDGLLTLYELQIRVARENRDLSQLVQFIEFRRGLLGDAHESKGVLSVRTQPPGAELYLFSSAEMGGVPEFDGNHLIGSSPIHNVPVEPGAYLLVARAEGYREAHQIVVMEGGGSRNEVIILSGWDTEVPLVGRSEAVAKIRLQHKWVVREKTHRAVILKGEVGTGKGRIVERVSRDIAKHPDDHYYLYHSASRYGKLVAYSAFVEMFRSRLGLSPSDGPDDIRRHLEEQLCFAITGVGRPEGLSPEDAEQVEELMGALSRLPGLLSLSAEDWIPWTEEEQQRVHGAVLTWLTLVSRRMHIVLIMRNIEWVDYASFQLMRELADGLRGTAFFMLVVEGSKQDDEHWNSFLHFHENISLQLLRKESVGHLFREVWQTPVSDQLIEATYAYSKGLPYAVERVVRGLMEERFTQVIDGRVNVSEEGYQRLLGAFDPVRSVRRRLSKFSPDVRSGLQAISLFESRFTVDGAEALGIRHPDKVLEVLRRAGFLESDQDDGAFQTALYRFKYPIERDSLRETLEPHVRRQFHEKLAVWLDEMGHQAPQWLAERAAHLRLSGREKAAVESYQKLGEVALSRRSVRDALRCFEMALSLSNESEERARLTERIQGLQEVNRGANRASQIQSGEVEG